MKSVLSTLLVFLIALAVLMVLGSAVFIGFGALLARWLPLSLFQAAGLAVGATLAFAAIIHVLFTIMRAQQISEWNSVLSSKGSLLVLWTLDALNACVPVQSAVRDVPPHWPDAVIVGADVPDAHSTLVRTRANAPNAVNQDMWGSRGQERCFVGFAWSTRAAMFLRRVGLWARYSLTKASSSSCRRKYSLRRGRLPTLFNA